MIHNGRNQFDVILEVLHKAGYPMSAHDIMFKIQCKKCGWHQNVNAISKHLRAMTVLGKVTRTNNGYHSEYSEVK